MGGNSISYNDWSPDQIAAEDTNEDDKTLVRVLEPKFSEAGPYF